MLMLSATVSAQTLNGPANLQVVVTPSAIEITTPSGTISYPFQQPIQPMAKPVQPAPPPVLPTVDMTSTNLLIQQCVAGIAAVKQDVDDGRKENQSFFTTVAGEWKNILKYSAPVVTALIAGIKLAPKP